MQEINSNDYIALLRDGTELVKINSLIKEDGINYAIGTRIVVKEYLKRTVSEKFHVEINSFKIKVESDVTEEKNIQKIGKDTYWQYRQSLKTQEDGFTDINKKIVEIRDAKGTPKDIADKLSKLLHDLIGLIEEKKELIDKRYCYSDSLIKSGLPIQDKTARTLAKVDTEDEVLETLRAIGVNIPKEVFGGITRPIY